MHNVNLMNFEKVRTISENEAGSNDYSYFKSRYSSHSLPVIFGNRNENKKKVDLFVEQSLRRGSVQYIKHVPMRLTRSKIHVSPESDRNNFSRLQIQNTSRRRESFLYKYETDSSISPERFSRQASVISGESSSNGCFEDIIVTPFAQILALLHRIRKNVSEMASIITKTTENNVTSDEKNSNVTEIPNENFESHRAKETMNMLDWCLENLENIQTDRSVSNLAMVKFKKMLNYELNLYDEESSADHQISDYICSTFLNDRFDKEDNLSANPRDSCLQSAADLHNKSTENNNFPLLGISSLNESKINKKFEASLDNWGMDLFEIQEMSNNVLTLVTYSIFKDRQIISLFKIPNGILVDFLLRIEGTYKNLPYHNSIHAADVIQTANVMLNSTAFQNVFTDLEIFSILFACSIHDVDHPGVTNQYLINTSDQLATLYNDQSVLENHHLATTFSILKDKNYDILSNLTKQEKSTFRKLVIDMVLATDMSHHMNLLADLKTMVETKKVSGSGLLNMDKYSNRVNILQNLVHCADLSNPTKPLVIYEKWIERIMEEFFIQGDKEKEMGMDISPMCDRENVAVDKTQIGFIDYIVHPLWETWSELVHPEAQIMLDTLAENRQYFCHRLCPSQTIDEVDSTDDELESECQKEN